LLYGWTLGYVAGGGASLLIPLYALALGGGRTAEARVAILGALFLGIGVSWAVIAVTATGLVTRLSAAADRGEAFGLYTAVTGLGTGAGSIAGGALAGRVGYGVTFGTAGLVVLRSAGVLVADARAERGPVGGPGDTET
jgi:predicted MFS family arabinose efflux permease